MMPYDYTPTDPNHKQLYHPEVKPRVVYVAGNWPSKLVYWLLGGMMALNVAVAVAAISAVGGTLFDISARMAVIETEMQNVKEILRARHDDAAQQ